VQREAGGVASSQVDAKIVEPLHDLGVPGGRRVEPHRKSVAGGLKRLDLLGGSIGAKRRDSLGVDQVHNEGGEEHSSWAPRALKTGRKDRKSTGDTTA